MWILCCVCVWVVVEDTHNTEKGERGESTWEKTAEVVCVRLEDTRNAERDVRVPLA